MIAVHGASRRGGSDPLMFDVYIRGSLELQFQFALGKEAEMDQRCCTQNGRLVIRGHNSVDVDFDYIFLVHVANG